ncbi:hypothetical protein GSI_03142 [Ganoderma sinense ZZ0214-1]|uniref:Methyltransferase domain-containing protein n=1 Tax=Ganoderma sinense ZZ0214-1 TaxID=1077348 RepID=A0A2G8SKT8_9APHY|nr:hypothetical protein GSI_03142 [Ganoderma sinense ZZ0214-1]
MADTPSTNTSGAGIPSKRDPNAFPLDEKMFKLLREQDLDLVRLYTGIKDHEEIKAHIINIQKEAYPIMPYQCIRFFSFAASRIHEVVLNYDYILKLGKERDDAIFLDVGTCFGTDLRKVVTDGWDAKNAVGTDINPGFWAMGHKLFHTDAASFPATFVPGNALADEHLQVFPILPTGSAVGTPRPVLSSLTSLNPLHGHVSVIYLGNVFHLFSEQEQLRLARGLAGLLSPEPGSVITGWQARAPQKGEKTMVLGRDGSAITQFLHSAESWKELWDGGVFEKGTVKVEAELANYKTEFAAGEFYFLRWSVTRA